MLFGKFCLLERVSVGGMAEVFRAKPLGAVDPYRYFAVKRILPHLAEDDDFITMFIDEARLTVQLRHPNVVQNYELGQFQSSHYIVMEFIAGQDLLALQKYVRNERTTVKIDMACHIMREIARGLDYVHCKTDEAGNPLNIIHRDISPQNVLVSWDGKVKVIDFGIAKAASQSTHTQAGVLKGKYGYMSPEQVRGNDIDHRSDIFSMGTLFWELLTNRRLFKAQNQYEVLTLIGEPEIQRPSAINPAIPPEVDEIAMRALEPERENRYQRAGDFAADLHRYLKEQKPPYHRSQLTTWIRSAFRENHEEELRKQEDFSVVNTAEDVRRLFAAKYKAVPKDDDEELDEATQIWDVDVLPDSDVDIEAYVAEHTVVQAGGLGLYGDLDLISDVEDDEEIEDRAAVPDTLDERRDVVEAKLEVAGLKFGSEAIEFRDDFADQKTRITASPAATRTRERWQHKRSPTSAAPPPLPPSPGFPVDRRTTILEETQRHGSAAVSTHRVVMASAAIGLVGLLAVGTVLVGGGDGGETRAQVSLTGSLMLEVWPGSELEVYLNGGLIGRSSPLSLPDLPPGQYSIEVRHREYPPIKKMLEVVGGELTSEQLNLAARGILDLRISSLPEEYSFFLNGEVLELPESPGSRGELVSELELPRGEYVFEGIGGANVRPIRETFVVEAGAQTAMRVEFEELLRLRVLGDADEEIYLDGRFYGSAPLAWPDMNPGDLYEIEIDGVKSVLGYPEIGVGEIDRERLQQMGGRREEDYGWLVVQSGEAWQHLFIDDVDTGLLTPLEDDAKIPVLAGTRVLGLKRGNAEQKYTVQIVPGETLIFRPRGS